MNRRNKKVTQKDLNVYAMLMTGGEMTHDEVMEYNRIDMKRRKGEELTQAEAEFYDANYWHMNPGA